MGKVLLRRRSPIVLVAKNLPAPALALAFFTLKMAV
jgi:hypothetical protein